MNDKQKYRIIEAVILGITLIIMLLLIAKEL